MKPLRKPLPKPPPIPTRQGAAGVRFDFNLGLRILLPAGHWHVVVRNADTGDTIGEQEIGAEMVFSPVRYFIRYEFEIRQNNELVFFHIYDDRNQDVLIRFPVGTLGDTIGWMPYADRFQALHDCRLTCAMNPSLIPLFQNAYPHIRFIDQSDLHDVSSQERFYASYSLGMFPGDRVRSTPVDHRVVGLHRQAAYILGVDPAEALPRVTVAQAPRLIADRYVCIAVQSSSLTKYWHYPNGWAEIVEFLRNAGYRVLCIDKEAEYGTADIRVKMPAAAEDWTGDRPLPERAHVLQHADFFVGLASGLAWLAWAVGTPVVMISGFSHPDTEFFTPYRVFNASVCNGCWNDLAYTFPLDNPLWCPRHAGTQRHFECSKAITVEDVKAAIRRIPAFGSISK